MLARRQYLEMVTESSTTMVAVDGDALTVRVCKVVYVLPSVLVCRVALAKRLVSATTAMEWTLRSVPRSNSIQQGDAVLQCHIAATFPSMAAAPQLRFSPEHAPDASPT